MELNKKILEDAKFKTRGKWYLSSDVDAFIDELSKVFDSVEMDRKETARRIKGLQNQVEDLQTENARLWTRKSDSEVAFVPDELDMKTAEIENGMAKQERTDIEELKEERQRLIDDVKALRTFKETFRNALEREAKNLTEYIEAMDSDTLL